MAPGTSGHFEIKIDPRGSDVAINYIINANFDYHPKNMHFYMDKAHTIELPVEDGRIIINGFIPLEDIINEENAIKDVSIFWEWPFESGNTEEERYKNNLEDTKSVGKQINIMK